MAKTNVVVTRKPCGDFLVSKAMRCLKVCDPTKGKFKEFKKADWTTSKFLLRILMEEYREGQKKLQFAFVDLEKACDRVPKEELWLCMRESGVVEKYVRLVQDMHESSMSGVARCRSEGGGTASRISWKYEVSQDCLWIMMFDDMVTL